MTISSVKELKEMMAIGLKQKQRIVELEAKVKELENRNEKVEHLYAESKDLIKELEAKIKLCFETEDLSVLGEK